MPNSSCTSACAPGSVRNPVPASTVADDEEVALALVDVHRLGDRLEPGAREPGQVGRALGAALGVGEPGAQAWPSTTRPPLAANTMSGRPGSGSMSSHLVAEVEVGLAQGLPLPERQLPVDAGVTSIHGLIA